MRDDFMEELNQILKIEEDLHVFVRVEFPTWSHQLRKKAEEFWFKWIGPNKVGYDQAVIDIGELIDFARKELRRSK